MERVQFSCIMTPCGVSHVPYFLRVIKPKQTLLQHLKHSANVNHMDLSFTYETNQEGSVVCKLFFDRHCMATGTGPSKTVARLEAMQKCIASLHDYPTLVSKHTVNQRFCINLDPQSSSANIQNELFSFSTDVLVDKLVFSGFDTEDDLATIAYICFCYDLKFQRGNPDITVTKPQRNYKAIFAYMSENGFENDKYKLIQ
jgi:hypothetical protein